MEAANEIRKFPRPNFSENVSTKNLSDPTAEIAMDISYYTTRMDMVHRACHEADPQIEKWLFEALTRDVSYPYLKSVMNIPCGRDYFYERYRKAFWVLDKIREKVCIYNE